MITIILLVGTIYTYLCSRAHEVYFNVNRLNYYILKSLIISKKFRLATSNRLFFIINLIVNLSSSEIGQNLTISNIKKLELNFKLNVQ